MFSLFYYWNVGTLAGDIVLCRILARHLTLAVPLSAQVYKWAPGEFNSGGNPAIDKHPIQGGEINLPTTTKIWWIFS